MNKDDQVLDIIDEINRRHNIPEDGYFKSAKDKAYRLEAIRNIFCGLEHENQNKVLRYAMDSLLHQEHSILVKEENTAQLYIQEMVPAYSIRLKADV